MLNFIFGLIVGVLANEAIRRGVRALITKIKARRSH